MIPPWIRACLVALLLAAGAPASAAVVGQPLLQRFGPSDYNADPANFKVLSRDDGLLLIGNSRGLLTFDGSRWELMELPGRSPARTLVQDGEGRVYVGGYDQFGRIDTDATGSMHYVDLRGEFDVAGEKADFGEVWEVLAVPGGILYRTSSRLFFAADDGRRATYPVDDNLRRMFVIGDEVVARWHGRGLTRFRDGDFSLLPGGEDFAERSLAYAFGRGNQRVLVSDDGLFISDANGIRKAEGADHAALGEYGPNAGLRLNDGSLVVGGDTGMLLHYSPQLKLLGVHKLTSYSVLELSTDREGGLWVASEGDLVRLRLPSPWSAFSAADGFSGAVGETAYYQDSLWIGTSTGVYRSRDLGGPLRFELAVDTVLEASALLEDRHGLLVGDREGLLFRDPDSGQAIRLIRTDSLHELLRSRFDADIVFAVSNTDVFRLRWENGGWRELSRWPLEGVSTSSLIEESATRVWLDNYRGGPHRLDYDPVSGALTERTVLDAEDGLRIDPAFGSTLWELDDTLYLISGERVFRRDGDRFLPFDGEPFSLAERRYEMSVSETEFGDFAFTPNQLFRRLPGTRDWQPVYLGAGLARGIRGMRTNADGVLRVVTWGGLLQFDPGVAEAPIAPLKVALSRLALRHSDGSGERLALDGGRTLEVKAGDSLQFDYRMVSMDPGVQFRFRIPGVTGGWSEWSAPSSPAVSLRSPGPGSYRLEVEGRTRMGRIGEPLRFDFSISPAWWQTTSARIGTVSLALLVLVGLVQLFVRFRYRQYLAINRKLEGKIAERTAELEQANRKLAELATEDSLTGVANRRALEQGLNREWERCAELKQPLALIMVDVDHFKQFNDRYGHLEGDQQLIRVARELSGRVRPVRELLARFGGEEFAIVLPGVTLEEAAARAETMRAAFDRDSFHTTVSVGVSAEVPTSKRTPTDLLRAADEALYAAKRGGRNRVVRAAA